VSMCPPPTKPDKRKVEKRVIIHNLKPRSNCPQISTHRSADPLCAQTGGDGYTGGRGLSQNGYF
jgi:hypothetical protein